MERVLEIEKYRNIGIYEKEKIVLNHTMEKGKMGELVIVVGPNNSGKSNVLDALCSFKNKNLSIERDKTTFGYKLSENNDEDIDLNPVLTLKIEDKCNKEYCGAKISTDNKYQHLCSNRDKYAYKPVYNPKKLFDSIVVFNNAIRNYLGLDKITSELREYEEKFAKEVSEEEFNKIYTRVMEIYEVVLKNVNKGYQYTNVYNYLCNNSQGKYLIEEYKKLNDENNFPKIMEEDFENKTGMKMIPNIIRYEEKKISKESLSTTVENIDNSAFFKSLFKAINYRTDLLKDAYKGYKNSNNINFLGKEEKKINKKLEAINKRFNDLYFLEKEKYEFSIKLETEKILFGMSRGNDPIILDYQSTGFKWFFNMYLNFLCTEQIKPGDVIVIDEIATSIHAQGQVELRKFLKEFARNNDLTFVVATQSPFLVDIDNYDELRIISIEDNVATINNSFAAIDPDDHDSLLAIKESLSVHKHVLYSPDTKVVFVEGITDYNYLTMFKKLLNKKDIAFLPIQGVGKNNESREQVRNKLITLIKNPILLVDNDKAGSAMKKICENSALEVISLNEIDASFREIESLFDSEDAKKHGILEKCSKSTSLMKNTLSLEDFEEKTIDNFTKLLDRLSE